MIETDIKKRIFNSQRLNSRWVQHSLFWLVYIIIFGISHSLRGTEQEYGTLLFELTHFAGIFIAVYVNLRLFIPRLLDQRKIFWYVMTVLILTGTISTAVTLFDTWMVRSGLVIHPHRGPKPPAFFILMFMTVQISFLGLTSFLHYVKESFRLNEVERQMMDLQSRQLQAELESLKAQINPHFLFNTLNNIYSHSLIKSEKAPEMILKLSDLMSYIIYDCREDCVPLEKEIDFIKNYITLERARTDEDISINLDINVSNTPYMVTPLLFIPFLENAFKHGVNIRRRNPYIDIKLSVNEAEQRLYFSIENLMDDDQLAEAGDKSRGIGLDNICKRLDLIYPDKHKIDIDTKDGKFRVTLEIDLSA